MKLNLNFAAETTGPNRPVERKNGSLSSPLLEKTTSTRLPAGQSSRPSAETMGSTQTHNVRVSIAKHAQLPHSTAPENPCKVTYALLDSVKGFREFYAQADPITFDAFLESYLAVHAAPQSSDDISIRGSTLKMNGDTFVYECERVDPPAYRLTEGAKRTHSQPDIDLKERRLIQDYGQRYKVHVIELINTTKDNPWSQRQQMRGWLVPVSREGWFHGRFGSSNSDFNKAVGVFEHRNGRVDIGVHKKIMVEGILMPIQAFRLSEGIVFKPGGLTEAGRFRPTVSLKDTGFTRGTRTLDDGTKEAGEFLKIHQLGTRELVNGEKTTPNGEVTNSTLAI